MSTEAETKERVAILEHRAEKTEQGLADLGQWMKEINANLTELVRLQTMMTSFGRDLSVVSKRLDSEIDARRSADLRSHEDNVKAVQTMTGNVVSIGWIRALVMLGLSATAGGAVTLVLGHFVP